MFLYHSNGRNWNRHEIFSRRPQCNFHRLKHQDKQVKDVPSTEEIDMTKGDDLDKEFQGENDQRDAVEEGQGVRPSLALVVVFCRPR